MNRIRIGIFISGQGSNAKKITQYFSSNADIEVVGIVSNNFSTPLLEDAEVKHLVKCFSADEMTSDSNFFHFCQTSFDYIVLAGYLKLVPKGLIHLFPQKIFNIHPALLPKYGGKGMYGMNVHRAVLANHETYSGVTIHLIDERYDEGNYLAQFFTNIENCKTAEEIAHEVQYLEHAYFAYTIEKTILYNLTHNQHD